MQKPIDGETRTTKPIRAIKFLGPSVLATLLVALVAVLVTLTCLKRPIWHTDQISAVYGYLSLEWMIFLPISTLTLLISMLASFGSIWGLFMAGRKFVLVLCLLAVTLVIGLLVYGAMHAFALCALIASTALLTILIYMLRLGISWRQNAALATYYIADIRSTHIKHSKDSLTRLITYSILCFLVTSLWYYSSSFAFLFRGTLGVRYWTCLVNLLVWSIFTGILCQFNRVLICLSVRNFSSIWHAVGFAIVHFFRYPVDYWREMGNRPGTRASSMRMWRLVLHALCIPRREFDDALKQLSLVSLKHVANFQFFNFMCNLLVIITVVIGILLSKAIYLGIKGEIPYFVLIWLFFYLAFVANILVNLVIDFYRMPALVKIATIAVERGNVPEYMKAISSLYAQ